MKYVTKKNLTYLNFGIGVISIIALIQLFMIMGKQDDLLSVAGQLGFLHFMYLMTMIGSIMSIGTAAYLYFGKQMKTKDLIINMVVAGVMLLMLLFANSAMGMLNDVNQLLGGNLGSAISLYQKYGDMSASDIAATVKNGLNLLTFVYVVGAAYGGYLLYLYRKHKGASEEEGDLSINIDPETVQKAQESAKQAFESGKQNVSAFSDKVKAYYHTPNGKKVIIAILSVVIFLFVYLFYVNVIRKTEIDLTNGCKIVVEGDSGSGHAYVSDCQIEYNQENARLASFVSSVRYEAQGENGSYANGDQVVFKAVYSEEEAKALKLKISEDTIETKVKGLKEYYASVNKIPNKVKQAIKNQMDAEVLHFMEDVTYGDKYTKFDDDRDIQVDSHELVGMLAEKDGDKISLHGIYKLTASGEKRTSYMNEEYEPLTQVIYVLYSSKNISSDYLKEMPEVSELNYTVFDQDDDRYAEMKLEKIAKKMGYFSGRLEALK